MAFPGHVLKFFSRRKSIGLLSSCLSGVAFIVLQYKLEEWNPSKNSVS